MRSGFVGLCLAPLVLGELTGFIVLAGLVGETFVKSERVLGDLLILIGFVVVFVGSLGLMVLFGAFGLVLAGVIRFFIGTRGFDWYVQLIEGPTPA
ncbi:MAG TPA: hypothetical protein VJ673_20170 [Aromatoleum sp.]|uniref:hypothetical protein n=1 Tax=Aromatoleum sp. TaxID=2307007 RepID=UPI002B49A732|nr:hypothetical protein [Aromatoleum sp.]HJV28008.1 hypothetical protein [Aromatoleum sp.]